MFGPRITRSLVAINLCYTVWIEYAAWTYGQRNLTYRSLDKFCAVWFEHEGDISKEVRGYGRYKCHYPFCPRNKGKIECLWNTTAWSCDADLEMQLEIIEPLIECKTPIENWIYAESCALTYKTKQRSQEKETVLGTRDYAILSWFLVLLLSMLDYSSTPHYYDRL